MSRVDIAKLTGNTQKHVLLLDAPTARRLASEHAYPTTTDKLKSTMFLTLRTPILDNVLLVLGQWMKRFAMLLPVHCRGQKLSSGADGHIMNSWWYILVV